jgi:hypothetical protein
MRNLAIWSVAFGLASAVAAACGSSDKAAKPHGDSGAGGEGGREQAGQGGSMTAPEGGSSTSPTLGGAGGEVAVDAGGMGGETSSTAGQGGATTGDGGQSSAGGAGGAGPEEVLEITFDDSGTLPANLDPGTAVLTPTQGFADLGPIGGKFGSTFLRGPTGTVITLTLSNLPPHTTLSLSMLFAAIDSLDGEGTFPAGDYFRITLDGNVIFRETFANAIETQIQTYDPPAGVVLARRVDLGFNGPGSYYTDSAYDFGQDPTFQNLPHTADSAVLVFTLEGEGVQSVDDESWAIDNLRVTVQ